MSVRRWKQIITIGLAAVLLFMSCTIIVLAVKVINSDSAEEIAKATEEKYGKLLNFFNGADDGAAEYTKKYENLYVDNDFTYVTPETKKCYLTFDDGPYAGNTDKILDVLKAYDVKATFFVVYNDSDEAKALYKRIVDEGHTLGIHTASHKYTEIYSSVDAYLEDFNKLYEYLKEVTGVEVEIFRFPGGSLNTYNETIYQELISEMIRRGFTYYDWNVSSGDAKGQGVSTSEIIEKVQSPDSQMNKKVVLLHDGPGHGNTVEALDEIIEAMLEQGYELEGLSNKVQPVVFGYAS